MSTNIYDNDIDDGIDDNFDDILGSDSDEYKRKDEKKNNYTRLSLSQKDDNNLVGDNKNYDRNKILDSLNDFDDNEFKYEGFNQNATESTIQQSENPLEIESNIKKDKFNDFIFNNTKGSKSFDSKSNKTDFFSFANYDSNLNAFPTTNMNNHSEKENSGYQSPFNDSMSGLSLLNNKDDDDILNNLGFGTKKINKPTIE
ncbi:hypothetical protein H8356DRAFT_1068813 [Neocallimastix lanati (nom. inval.)]|uniref:Uncharacterized protein n=1 Tax=Neocallimastix californiae TaxID=1754190 RepID=A0A1Y2DUF9_9FUNG|nr:hypothetical protein H8356DRAFT_1068813 [Neocallimastix sp. JGI-2020a]ORY62819.1 hypothetical protein LY90DRAFT_668356 [Neocallimastix californiae]|eukprot:ORY62819.1 hypothetical protein LY90DRAFT_668356 [Neocallimastix californiae]